MLYFRTIMGREPERRTLSYTSSVADDKEIAEDVVLTMMAHVLHLIEAKAMPRGDGCKILRELADLLMKPEALIREGFEDVHEALEQHLISRIGDAGGWVGVARSRNDHVATAHRLRLRRLAVELLKEMCGLCRALLEKASENIETYMVAFTHQQPAQVTTVAHYLLSVVEMIETHVDHIAYVLERIVNRSPLGSSALAGTIVPIDRRREAELLRFSDVVENTMYAVESRDYFTTMASAVVSFLVELSRLVNDLIVWSMPEVGYVRLPDSHVSTSSIMPHKRNPVTLEVLRARIGEAVGSLMAMYEILRPLGKGYYLDLQELTRHAWKIMHIAIDGVRVLTDLVKKMEFDRERLLKDVSSYPITSAETAERICLETGRPFRLVYAEVARMVREGGSGLLRPEEVVRMKSCIGSPNPERIRAAIEERLRRMELFERRVEELRAGFDEAAKRLIDLVESTCRGC